MTSVFVDSLKKMVPKILLGDRACKLNLSLGFGVKCFVGMLEMILVLQF